MGRDRPVRICTRLLACTSAFNPATPADFQRALAASAGTDRSKISPALVTRALSFGFSSRHWCSKKVMSADGISIAPREGPRFPVGTYAFRDAARTSAPLNAAVKESETPAATAATTPCESSVCKTFMGVFRSTIRSSVACGNRKSGRAPVATNLTTFPIANAFPGPA